MEDFKRMVKMKTGGSVSEEVKKCSGGMMKKKVGGKVHSDEAEDKVLIKKMIDKEEKGEKPELKLKKGGRTAKAEGTVKKFKAGGMLDVPSKAAVKGKETPAKDTKPAGDKDAIKKVKPTGDKKADTPNKAAVKPNRTGKNAVDDIQVAKGGKVKKFADGGPTGAPSIPPEIAAQIQRAQQAAAAAQAANQARMSQQDIAAAQAAKQAQIPQAANQARMSQQDIAAAQAAKQAQIPQGVPANNGMSPQMLQQLLAARARNQAGNFRAPGSANAGSGMNPEQIGRVIGSPAMGMANANNPD